MLSPMPPAPDAAADRSARPVVLIVDDDPNILDFLSIALDDEGFQVHTAANGADGIDWLERNAECQPAVIILDLWMPVMDGYAFLKAFRARPAPHAAVLALTAAQYSAANGPAIDAEEFLTKPFSLDDLIDVVKRLAGVRA